MARPSAASERRAPGARAVERDPLQEGERRPRDVRGERRRDLDRALDGAAPAGDHDRQRPGAAAVRARVRL